MRLAKVAEMLLKERKGGREDEGKKGEREGRKGMSYSPTDNLGGY